MAEPELRLLVLVLLSFSVLPVRPLGEPARDAGHGERNPPCLSTPPSSTTPTSTGRSPSTPTSPRSTPSSARPPAAVLRGGAALYPTSTATSVRVKGGKGGDVVTTDGPYAETKEALTGFYLIETDDLDAAIAIAAQIPGAWDGTVEVRPVIDFGG